MKDFILTKADLTVVGRLRVDIASNTASRFTIQEMFDGTGKSVDTLDVVGGYYKKVDRSMATFIAFCTTNNMKITSRDANGDNPVTLLLNQSAAGTHYPIVSATGSTKTFLVATDVTASFSAGNILKVYNADHTVWGTFTHASDSYGAPNTSIVVVEVLTDIPVSSGKYIVNLG